MAMKSSCFFSCFISLFFLHFLFWAQFSIALLLPFSRFFIFCEKPASCLKQPHNPARRKPCVVLLGASFCRAADEQPSSFPTYEVGAFSERNEVGAGERSTPHASPAGLTTPCLGRCSGTTCTTALQPFRSAKEVGGLLRDPAMDRSTSTILVHRGSLQEESSSTCSSPAPRLPGVSSSVPIKKQNHPRKPGTALSCFRGACEL